MNNTQKRSAVVVGISSYKDGFTSLPNTKNDAERLARVLIEKCQFDPNRVYLMVDNSKRGEEFYPTKSNILSKIGYLLSDSSKNEIMLFFFAGHGAEVSGKPYLVTADTRMNVLDQTAISVEELNASLENSTMKFTLRVFDACRNNFGIGRALLQGMTSELEAALLKKVSGWATFSACSSGQFAYEDTDTEHGIFSRFICEGLEGKAADSNGVISLEGLVAYVKGAMDTWCDQRIKSQHPQFQLDISGHLVLSQISTQQQGKDHLLSNKSSFPMSSYLVSALDSHLNQIPDDVRNLAITSSEQAEQAEKLLHTTLSAGLMDIHPYFKISLSNFRQVDFRKTDHLSDAYNLALSTNAAGEWREVRITRAIFDSSVITISSSILNVALIRFTFFYWIWWDLVCDKKIKGLERTYDVKPPMISDYRVVAPSAALTESKIKVITTEMLAQSTEQIIQWTRQLAEFLDKTVDHVRKFKDIIE